SNFIPLISKMKNISGIRVFITIENNEGLSFPEIQSLINTDNICFIKANSAVFRKWHYAFTTEQSYLYFKRDITLAFSHHGCAFGNADKNSKENCYHERRLNNSRYSLYFLNSYSEVNKYQKLIKNSKQKKFLVSGLPKLDSLFNRNKSNDKDFLKQQNLNPAKKTILISSHWKEKSLLASLGASLIDHVLSLNKDCNVLLIAHEHLWTRFDNHKLFDRLIELEQKYENFLFITKCIEHHDIIKTADLFICDYSSIFVEHCIVDKPIIFFDNRDYNFQDNTVKLLFEEASSPFAKIEELNDLIEPLIYKPAFQAAERKAVVHYFQDNRGRATDYIINKILEIGRVSGPSSNKWQDI
ncbi:MAG: CDP-glycerol glycerophosphotransferase family protein, partial [Thalassotalea sp.]|nr:CDP-glycerol glycerophosphotransferase family protein [Thalassotalea sp.]